jgi:hypothetical protein
MLEIIKDNENSMINTMSIKIYLTKSSEVAHVIARGYGCDLQNKVNGIERVQHGAADGKEIIPVIYHNKGYFYCAVEYEGLNDSQNQKYELIIA